MFGDELPQASWAYLEPVDTDSRGPVFELHRASTTFGTAPSRYHESRSTLESGRWTRTNPYHDPPELSWSFAPSTIQRLDEQHATVSCDTVTNSWSIVDHSTFGTTLNGARLCRGDRRALAAGDVIVFGGEVIDGVLRGHERCVFHGTEMPAHATDYLLPKQHTMYFEIVSSDDPDDAGVVFVNRRPMMRIGVSDMCHMRVSFKRSVPMSRINTAILSVDGEAFATTVMSKSTWVNGTHAERQRIVPGDVLDIGGWIDDAGVRHRNTRLVYRGSTPPVGATLVRSLRYRFGAELPQDAWAYIDEIRDAGPGRVHELYKAWMKVCDEPRLRIVHSDGAWFATGDVDSQRRRRPLCDGDVISFAGDADRRFVFRADAPVHADVFSRHHTMYVECVASDERMLVGVVFVIRRRVVVGSDPTLAFSLRGIAGIAPHHVAFGHGVDGAFAEDVSGGAGTFVDGIHLHTGGRRRQPIGVGSVIEIGGGMLPSGQIATRTRLVYRGASPPPNARRVRSWQT